MQIPKGAKPDYFEMGEGLAGVNIQLLIGPAQAVLKALDEEKVPDGIGYGVMMLLLTKILYDRKIDANRAIEVLSMGVTDFYGELEGFDKWKAAGMPKDTRPFRSRKAS